MSNWSGITEIGNRSTEVINPINISDIAIDRNQYSNAKETLNQALKIADEIERNQTRNEARFSFALTHLLALTTITEAQQFDYPLNNHNIHKLHGLILLHQGNTLAADAAFTKSITECDILLAKSDHNYRALDSKALALSGLALCNNDPAFHDQSRQVFLQARAINTDTGYLKRQKRLFDKLAECDTAGTLTRFWEEVAA